MHGGPRPAEWAVFYSKRRLPIRIRDSPLTLDNISVRLLTAADGATRDIRGSLVRHSPCSDAKSVVVTSGRKLFLISRGSGRHAQL